MTVSIYGEELAFFKNVMAMPPQWRSKEYDGWAERAQTQASAGNYYLAADNLLDALCYDSREGASGELTSCLLRAGVFLDLSIEAGKLISHMNKTGKFGLAHLKLVAKLQHDLRSHWLATESGRQEMLEKYEEHLVGAFREIVATMSGLRSFEDELTDQEAEDLTNQFLALRQSPEIAFDAFKQKLVEHGVTPEAADKMLSAWQTPIKVDVLGTEGNAAENADQEQESEWEESNIIEFCRRIEEVRAVMFECQRTGNIDAMVTAWQTVLEEPVYTSQLDFFDFDDLHATAQWALKVYKDSSAPEALDGALYLLHALVESYDDDEEELRAYVMTYLGTAELHHKLNHDRVEAIHHLDTIAAVLRNQSDSAEDENSEIMTRLAQIRKRVNQGST